MISPKTYEERLSYLYEVNQTYANQILQCMENNPEFLRIGHLISLTEHPVNFNLNKNEKYNPDAPANVFEFLLYYIAESGVRATYGYAQWIKIRTYIRMNKADPLTNLKLLDLQPKKQQIYINLNNILLKYNIKAYDLTLIQIIKLQGEIKGVGDGAITFLKSLYAPTTTTLPNYSDIGFKKGFMKFYGLNKKPTKKQIFDKSKNWTHLHIINMLMMQCYHYL